MRRNIKTGIKTGAILLVIVSWLALCGIGLISPTLIRQPLARSILNLRNTNLNSESVETWNAVRPVSEFTKTMGDRIVLLSTLMFAGFIAFVIVRMKED